MLLALFLWLFCEFDEKVLDFSSLEQQIDISYDLVGMLPAAMLNDLQNGETA